MIEAKRRSGVASRSSKWQRLATGELAARARAIAVSVGDELRDIDLDGTPDVVPGLYLGHAGLAVLFDQLHRIDRTGGWRAAREHHLAKAMQQASSGWQFSLQFGALGVAWLLHRLGRSAGVDVLDAALAAFLRSDAAATTPYHLTFGLGGIAVYALERDFADRELRAIVAALARSAESTRDGTTWKWRMPRAAHYNLGTLTGVPGVVAVLALLGTRLRWPRQAKALFASSVRWLRMQRRRDGRFPPRIPRPRRASDEPCYLYGEVGLAGIFMAAEHSTLAPLATELVQLAAARCANPGGRSESAPLHFGPGELVDLTLCHGSAGVAHVFNRIAQGTGDRAHRELALRWLAATCDAIEGGSGKPRPWRTWCKRPGFVDGAAGVALVLAAASSSVEPTWDRLLLLSRPGAT